MAACKENGCITIDCRPASFAASFSRRLTPSTRLCEPSKLAPECNLAHSHQLSSCSEWHSTGRGQEGMIMCLLGWEPPAVQQRDEVPSRRARDGPRQDHQQALADYKARLSIMGCCKDWTRVSRRAPHQARRRRVSRQQPVAHKSSPKLSSQPTARRSEILGWGHCVAGKKPLSPANG